MKSKGDESWGRMAHSVWRDKAGQQSPRRKLRPGGRKKDPSFVYDTLQPGLGRGFSCVTHDLANAATWGHRQVCLPSFPLMTAGETTVAEYPLLVLLGFFSHLEKQSGSRRWMNEFIIKWVRNRNMTVTFMTGRLLTFFFLLDWVSYERPASPLVEVFVQDIYVGRLHLHYNDDCYTKVHHCFVRHTECKRSSEWQWMEEQMDKWMHRWMDRQMDACMNK